MRSTALCSRKLYAEKDQRYNASNGGGTGSDCGQHRPGTGTETDPHERLGKRSTAVGRLLEGLARETGLDAQPGSSGAEGTEVYL